MGNQTDISSVTYYSREHSLGKVLEARGVILGALLLLLLGWLYPMFHACEIVIKLGHVAQVSELLGVTLCALKTFHSTMMWNLTRRDSKNARIEANEPHLSDVSAEDLGTDSPGADKDVKESRLIRNQLRDSLEEQVFIQ